MQDEVWVMDATVAEHPNVALFRRGYEAFNSGDLDFVRAAFDEDIVWHGMGRSRFSRTSRGIDETLASFVELMQATNGTFHSDVHDVLANDTHGVALVTSHWEADGARHEDNGVHVVHLKDGKVTESWFFDWNPYIFDEQFPR